MVMGHTTVLSRADYFVIIIFRYRQKLALIHASSAGTMGLLVLDGSLLFPI